jgi:hypothetical protein
MAIQGFRKFHIDPVWNDSFKQLEYIQEPFNDPESQAAWEQQGYGPKFTGAMCDMRRSQPTWNNFFQGYFAEMGWHNIGTSYYRMDTGTVLPEHRDLYKRYVEIFNLQGKEQSIRRAIVFLEDWKSGHYLEIAGTSITQWSAGDAVSWSYDCPHMAANIGIEPRYTLQITGHTK